MAAKLSRRRILSGSTAAIVASGIAPRLTRAAGNVTEIRALLITGSAVYPKYWETLTQQFKEKTGITVSYDMLAFTPLTSKEVTLGAAHSAQYDVYSTHTAQIGSFFNYFEPLNQYFSASELADFHPVAMKYLTDPRTGKLAAIPRNVDARVQYYRKDVYDAHHLQPAKTWDELVTVSQALTGDGHYGLVVPGQGDPAQRTFSDLLWQAGGDWVDDKNVPSFNSAEGIQALTYYRDLIHKYKVVPSDAVTYQWTENTSEFASGAVYDTFNWPSTYAILSNPETSKVVGKWATAPYVRNKTAISCAVSHAMALNSLSKKKDAALEFIKHVVSPDSQMLAFQQFTYFPSRQAVAKSVISSAQGQQAEWLGQLQTTIDNGKEWPKLPGFSKVCTLMYGAIERALSDQMSPADSLNQAAKEAHQAMQQAGAYN
jgi:ABC-type glycerol-3-phosphate transport system substrate-binding protein